MRGRARHFGYKPPGTDSAKARAAATLFLINARSLDGVTAGQLAHNHRLKPATAERMLRDAREQRARLC